MDHHLNKKEIQCAWVSLAWGPFVWSFHPAVSSQDPFIDDDLINSHQRPSSSPCVWLGPIRIYGAASVKNSSFIYFIISKIEASEPGQRQAGNKSKQNDWLRIDLLIRSIVQKASRRLNSGVAGAFIPMLQMSREGRRVSLPTGMEHRSLKDKSKPVFSTLSLQTTTPLASYSLHLMSHPCKVYWIALQECCPWILAFFFL